MYVTRILHTLQIVLQVKKFKCLYKNIAFHTT